MPWWLLRSWMPGDNNKHTPPAAGELPQLYKLQEPQHQRDHQPNYCSRMAFKLTPRFSRDLDARVRWLRVLRAAQTPAGGAWRLQFASSDMTPARLQALMGVIDGQFFGGSFAAVCGPPAIEVSATRLGQQQQQQQQQQQPGPEGLGAGSGGSGGGQGGGGAGGGAGALSKASACNAVAGYEPARNTIVFFQPAWRRRPSLRCPVQADGVVCTNKLSWLAHTLAHEMVHSIIAQACSSGSSSSSSGGYHGHDIGGPGGHDRVFMSLNRHIFGHSTAVYRVGASRLPPRLLRVAPLVPTPQLALQQQEQEVVEEAAEGLGSLQQQQQQHEKPDEGVALMQVQPLMLLQQGEPRMGELQHVRWRGGPRSDGSSGTQPGLSK